MLNAEKIKQLAKGCGYDIHTAVSVDSTNNVLKRLAANGEKEGYMLFSEEQTAGRGRQGRSFFSPKSGIYTSLLLRPMTDPTKTLYFTTAAAVAVCRAIEAAANIKAQIKWVNDVYIGEKKVCGILTESSISGGVTDWAVVGIGVNLVKPDGGFPKEISDRACALFDSEADMPKCFPDRFAAALALQLKLVYSQDRQETAQEYRSRSMLIGRTVTACDGGKERVCRVLDVSDSAELIVEFEDETRGRLYSGEVRVRL